MELRPTPQSWRIALCTAIGAAAIVIGGLVLAIAVDSPAGIAAGSLIMLAALATFVPALGTLSATVDTDAYGVTVHRLGRVTRFAWTQVTDVRVVDRPASVPDGTEYHWVVPRRPRHIVAVPVLDLVNGQVRELPALAAPASGPGRDAAVACADALTRFRGLAAGEAPIARSA